MLCSIIGSIITKKTMTMLQTEAGFNTASFKRMKIAEHLRYVPMGYFNSEGLGKVTSIATNTMENLSGVASRCVMVVSKGIITSLVIIVFMLFFNDLHLHAAFEHLLGEVVADPAAAYYQQSFCPVHNGAGVFQKQSKVVC